MRRFGQFLAVLGLVIGSAAAVAVGVPVHMAGISWLIGVGLLKLTFAASLGLMAGGAVIQRIALRAEERDRLLVPGVGVDPADGQANDLHTDSSR